MWFVAVVPILIVLFIAAVLFLPEVFEDYEYNREDKAIRKFDSSLDSFDRTIIVAVKTTDQQDNIDFFKCFKDNTDLEEYLLPLYKKIKNIVSIEKLGLDNVCQEKLEDKSVVIKISQKDFENNAMTFDDYDRWKSETVIGDSLTGKAYIINKNKLANLKKDKKEYFDGLVDKNNVDEEIVELFDNKISEYTDKLEKLEQELKKELVEAIKEDVDLDFNKNFEKDNEHTLKTMRNLLANSD